MNMRIKPIKIILTNIKINIMALFSKSSLRIILIFLASSVLVYLATEYHKKNLAETTEAFEETVPTVDVDSDIIDNKPLPEPELTTEVVGDIKEKKDDDYDIMPSEDSLNEQYRPVDFEESKVSNDCFPKDKLSAEDLLPKDSANSKWSQVNPSGQGELKNANFLNAGYHVGVNTIGSSMRNANLQLRSEPPNPQIKVSPFMNSTIMPDLNRRPLEINGCD